MCPDHVDAHETSPNLVNRAAVVDLHATRGTRAGAQLARAFLLLFPHLHIIGRQCTSLSKLCKVVRSISLPHSQQHNTIRWRRWETQAEGKQVASVSVITTRCLWLLGSEELCCDGLIVTRRVSVAALPSRRNVGRAGPNCGWFWPNVRTSLPSATRKLSVAGEEFGTQMRTTPYLLSVLELAGRLPFEAVCCRGPCLPRRRRTEDMVASRCCTTQQFQ